MALPFRSMLLVAVTAVSLAAWGPVSVCAQITGDDPPARSPGTVANVFETLDPNQPLDALRIRLPAEWTFESVRLLRYGTEPVPLRVQAAEEPGVHQLVVSTPIRGPHDLVVRVQTPDLPGTAEWSLHTLVREAGEGDTLTAVPFRTVERYPHSLRVAAPSELDQTDPTNWALSLEEASEPLLVGAA
mgnify:CR=1 FL=1